MANFSSMKLIASLVLFSFPLLSQITSVDVAGIAFLAANGKSTTLQTVTGTDGTVCTLSKQPNSTIYTTFGCQNGNGKSSLKTIQLQSTDNVAFAVTLGQQSLTSTGALCVISVNPTASAITASYGNIPSNGIFWQCSGSTGQLTGSAFWP